MFYHFCEINEMHLFDQDFLLEFLVVFGRGFRSLVQKCKRSDLDWINSDLYGSKDLGFWFNQKQCRTFDSLSSKL